MPTRSQVAVQRVVSTGALAAVVLFIADPFPSKRHTIVIIIMVIIIIVINSLPHITVNALSLATGRTTPLAIYRAGTVTHSLWYWWPKQVSRYMVYSPYWTLFTVAEWGWFGVAHCSHVSKA